jgi:hypothetical protein
MARWFLILLSGLLLLAGFATRASFAGHPSRSATTGHALTFNPDHLMGAGQSRVRFARLS